MMYADLATAVALTPAAIAAMHPGVSFPPVIEPHHVAELGIVPLEYAPQPATQTGETLAPGEVTIAGDRAIQGWTVVPAPPHDWSALIAARRYEAEISGIGVDGMHVGTDDRSKLLINGAALEAVIDPDYVMQWKTPAGFVPLDAEQVIGVARAVRAHVQACFDREAELLGELEAGTLTPEMLEEGWPNEPLPESAPS